MANASMKHGAFEFWQGFCNMIKAIVRTIFIMFAALGIFYTLQISKLAPKVEFGDKPIYEFGAE